MNHPVEIFIERRHEARIPSKDSFTLRTDLKHVWLQKAALWILAKLGARVLDREVAYTRHVIDTRDVLDKLAKAREAVRRSLTREPTVVLIGADDFEAIIGAPQIRNVVHFDAQYKVGGAHGVSIMGMRVFVLPWMRGVLPLPQTVIGDMLAARLRPGR